MLLEEESSCTHFILGDVDRRLIELERDIPPQEGTPASSKTFEKQTKRMEYVEAPLQVNKMEIEAGNKVKS